MPCLGNEDLKQKSTFVLHAVVKCLATTQIVFVWLIPQD